MKTTVYMSTKDIESIKKITKEMDIKISFVYNNFLRMISSCENFITATHAKTEIDKSVFPISINEKLAISVLGENRGRINFNRTFAEYAKIFINANSNKSVSDLPTYPALAVVYLKKKTNGKVDYDNI